MPTGLVHYSDQPPPETAPAPDTPAAVAPPAAKPKMSEAPAPPPAAPPKAPVAPSKPAPSVIPTPPAALPSKATTTAAGSIPAPQVAPVGRAPAEAEGPGLLDILQTIFGLVVIGTSIWVFIDARKIGARKGLVTGMANLSPVGWLVASLLIWVVAFPLYLAKRGTLRTRAAAA